MKRMLTWAVAVLAAAGGGLAVFGWLASRDAAPSDESEFAAERPEVAPEANAFTYFLEATNLLVETTNAQLVADFLAGKAADGAELRELVERNAACLARVRRGTECAICWMPTTLSFDTEFPYLTAWLKIGKLLAVQSRLARLAGRPEEAATAALTEARMGNLVLNHAESMLHFLVGGSLVSQGLEALLELPATADRAAALEGLGPFDAGLARALAAEGRYAEHVVGQLADGQIDVLDLVAFGNAERNWRMRLLGGILRSSYFFKPHAAQRELRDVFRRMIRSVSLTYAQIDPNLGRVFGRGWTEWIRPNVVGRLLRIMLIPPAGITLERKCRYESLLAGAKLATACHRYAQENGRLPETLQALVPEYLAAVPRDPYDGEPFRYSAEKGLVWSVGKNLTDEGGSTRVPGSEQECVASRDRPKAEDFVFDLRPAAKE